MPAGRESVVIDGGTGAATIVMLNALETDRLAASVTLAVKSNAPTVVGVPEIAPALDKLKPVGKAPAAIDQI